MKDISVNCNVLESSVLDEFNSLMDMDGVTGGLLLPNASHSDGFSNGQVIESNADMFCKLINKSSEQEYTFVIKTDFPLEVISTNKEFIFNDIISVIDSGGLVEVGVDKCGSVWIFCKETWNSRIIDDILGIFRKYYSGFEVLESKIHVRNGWVVKKGKFYNYKGALLLSPGERTVVLGDINRGSYIVESRSDKPEWVAANAGRILGRRRGVVELNDQSFSKSTGDVLCYMDEKAKEASHYTYKNILNVIKQQKKKIRIVDHIKPIINVRM